jgi:sodium-independent sulfate anion transporter 11
MPDKTFHSRAGNFVTEKVLGIDRQERYSKQPDDLDSCAKRILHPADIYLEEEPTVTEWLHELLPSRAGALNYIQGLFPSAFWVRRYNLGWLLGDVIAGKP